MLELSASRKEHPGSSHIFCSVVQTELVSSRPRAGSSHKERLSSQASDFSKTFREEMKKGMDQQFGGKDGLRGPR